MAEHGPVGHGMEGRTYLPLSRSLLGTMPLKSLMSSTELQNLRFDAECNKCKAAGFPNQLIGFQNVGTQTDKKWKLWEKAADGKVSEHQHRGEQKQSGYGSGPRGKWLYYDIIVLPVGVSANAPLQPGSNIPQPSSNVAEALKSMQPISLKDGGIQFTNDGRLILAKREWKAYE